MISEAIIAGQIHQAVFKKDNGYCIVKYKGGNSFQTSPLQYFDFNSFNLSQTEFEHFRGIDWTTQKLEIELAQHIKKFDALDLFLNGMDVAYEQDLRKEAILLLVEDYINDAAIVQFVKNRVLGTSLPDGFDPLTAAQLSDALGFEILRDLYNNLSYSKNIVVAIRNAWKNTILEDSPYIQPEDTPQLDKDFTDFGVFSGFVEAVIKKDTKAFDNVILAKAVAIKQMGIQQPPIFLTNLKRHFLLLYPFDTQVDLGADLETEGEIKKGGDFVSKLNEAIYQFAGIKKKKWNIKNGGEKSLTK